MTSGQHIDYDALALQALRGVVRACLAQVSRTGLLGDHHFYIAFNTQAPGVGMSKRLKEKYPVEMTIVLQHRFWDLAVEDERFEVKLTFDGIPERLVVPFAAVKVFYDPSVPYVLQFEEVDLGAQTDGARRGSRRAGQPRQPAAGNTENASASEIAEPADNLDRNERRRPVRRPRADDAAGDAGPDVSRPGKTTTDPAAPPPATAKPAPAAPPAAQGSKPAIVAVGSNSDEGEARSEDGKAGTDTSGAKIFDLSKFRGKK